jgi:hypothetical protein
MNEEEYFSEINKIDPVKMAMVEGRCFPQWIRMLSEQQNLYYYTDINALINGILKDRETICLWASRWSHLNDPEEIISGINELKAEFGKDLYWIPEGIERRTKHNHSLSFSVYPDYLPMWKMYGDGGKGVMLTFDTKEIVRKFGGLLQPCIYKGSGDYKQTREKIFKISHHPELKDLTIVQQQYVMIWMLQLFVSITKNEEYMYEKEVRLIGMGNDFFGDNNMQKYRVSDNHIIPYVEVFLPIQTLKEICIGPLVKNELNAETLRELLYYKGYSNVIVKSSNIHYR